MPASAPAPGTTPISTTSLAAGFTSQLIATPITTSVARGGPWWANWADLISFRPSTSIQTALKSRSSSWYVHKIEDAYGDINLDLYPVAVSRLPTFMSAEEVLEMVRTEINSFVDGGYAQFDPYDEKYPPAVFDDEEHWDSSSPESTVLSIQMRMGTYLNPDDGSVVCSKRESNFWIFSTIYTDKDYGHPVSGNRQFGFIRDPATAGGYIFFTRGADRATGILDDLPVTPLFTMADLLWKSFQERLVDYINAPARGGSATVSTPISKRVFWPAVKHVAWKPTVLWL